jgi:predicted amidohydrolase YtcJ
MMPEFVDNHVHFFEGGAALNGNWDHEAWGENYPIKTG